MHSYLTETLYVYWRRMRDAVRGLLPRPELPVSAATVPADRQELFVRLAALRATRAGEAEQYRHESETLTARWRETQTAADTLHHQLNTMQHANLCRSLDHTAAEDRLLRQIVAKSSMSLCVFIEEMDAELSVLHRTEDTIIPTAHRDYIVGKKSMGLSTDAVSRKHRAVALNAARARAVEMQGELMSVEQLNTELIRLRRSLPSVENIVLHNERASIVAYN